jgi:dihydroflavonol-4-reductase
MRVFVTGGNGFVGSAVVRELLRRGHTVSCLVRETSQTTRIDTLPVARSVGDVRDIRSFCAAMSDCDATVHLAAPGGWGADDPAALRAVIEHGTDNVLRVAESLDAHRVVFVSSTAAIAASAKPTVFDETAEFNVGSRRLHYSHAKHRAEVLVRAAHERGVSAVIVNPAEIYGPGDIELVSASNVIDFLESTPVLVCRGGTSVVHVDDVATGVRAALERGRSGERYILGGDNLSIRELATLVLELAGRRATVLTVPSRVSRVLTRAAVLFRIPLPYEAQVVEYATRYWFVDNTKARTELHVEFRGARQTLADTIEWLRREGHLTA